MALNESKLRRQESMVRRLHPGLEEISIEVTPLHKAPLEDIAALIDDAWRRAYGKRIRIAYTPAFLRYCMGPEPVHGFAITAYANNVLQGAILALPLDVLYRRQSHAAVLTTGLCVSEAWAKQGLLELLMLRHGQALLDTGIPWSFHWRAAKGVKASGAGDTLAHAAASRLYVRSLRSRRAATLGGLGVKEALGLGALNLAYGARTCFDRLPGGFQVREINRDNAESAVTLLRETAPVNGLSPEYSPDRLAWDCGFDEDGIRAAGWVLMRDDVPYALAQGYVNPVSDTDCYFAMDRLVFAPSLKKPSRRAFLARVERAVSRRFGCFAVLMTDTACEASPVQLGYRAVKTYFWGAAESGLMPEFSPGDLEGLSLPLR